MDETDGGRGEATSGADYAARLTRLESSTWKRLLGVQAPYRWNLRRLHLGRVLDVGCGIGRNLGHLDGNGVGVDHNPDSIAVARQRGLTVYVPEDFLRSPDARKGSFDSMLVAHVLEHLHADAADELLRTYLPYVRPGGRVVLITPQEVGYRTDETHVRFVDARELERQAHSLGLTVTRSYSFPFPRAAGKVFAYNEFVVVADRSPAG
ncbi:Methyltransferase domain-containing protein [Pedococcus cremeus]|uniref:Methyltransferase domain-containing protein n=1 Tax=Pedococcus cremeus TaxID=587636 RepID=A0A1H9XAJ9_9MICO|nr:class I SAM-dependent methyltransferase [Pedococcus cremeus]SES43238.1 Methyltransferase domain-containing protein [Pedococcus cremeus]